MNNYKGIVLATRNKNKIREIKFLLQKHTGKDFDILSLDEIGITDDIEENGTTFAENAIIKAKVPAALGYIGIADDSGLCVNALNGDPGVYSARYAGSPCNDLKNNCKLLGELNAANSNDRSARFICTIAAVDPNGRSFYSTGKCDGIILFSPRGSDGFGYDPFFYYPPLNKTFAELTMEEKNNVSHRAEAVKIFSSRFIDFLEGLNEQ